MNVDNNRRFQETEAMIFQAYGRLANVKELDRITTADICREAGIHRTTFYGHFKDVADLETKIMKDRFYRFYEGFFDDQGKWSFYDGMLAQVRFFKTYRKTIRRHLGTNSYERTIEEYLDREIIMQHMDAYKRAFRCDTDEEVWYHQEFFFRGLLAIVRKWVMNDCPEPEEEIAGMITRFCGLDKR